MATRVPLVIVNGQIEQLQSGDQITAAAALADTRTLTSGETTALSPIGAPVYISGAGAFKRAQANALPTSAVVGLVYDPAGIAAGASGQTIVGGILTATTAQWDAVVTGEVGGLTPGAPYWLDPANPGKMVSTAPTTAGQVVAPIGYALSTVDFEVNIARTVLL